MEEQALYVRDGDGYVGTILTQGGWDPDGANGGTVLALLGHCLDEVPTLVPMTLSRFTADLVRPVPIGRRLHVESTVLREGKKIQVVQLLLLVDRVEHVRATALRLRDADLTVAAGAEPDAAVHRVTAGTAGTGSAPVADSAAVADGAARRAPLALPASTTDARPADVLVPPAEAVSLGELRPEMPGFLQAVDMRRARARDGSSTGCWVRLRTPVVAGEPVGSTARLACTFDFANLIGMDGHPGDAVLINPDVTAHVLRPTIGEWVAITGDTRFDLQLGRGVSSAVLSDEHGVFGVASTSQLIQLPQ